MSLQTVSPQDCKRWKYADRSAFEMGDLFLLAEDIKKMQLDAKNNVVTTFKEYFKEGDITKGKNLLISEVAERFVLNFLNKEQDEISKGNEITVLDLEEEYQISLTTYTGG